VEELFRRTEEHEGYELAVDLENCRLSDNHGLQLSFEVDEYRRQCLLQGLDDIAITLQLEDKIAAYEARYPEYYLPDPAGAAVRGGAN
jgi:3-isopropylmalate/(R)-2-methylmalate dehydratase small subunit